MVRRTHCQVCLSGTGEERNVTTGCMLRLDLENSLNLQLLVTVSSLAICSPCCSLIEMWSLFAARARTNLAAVSQNSSQLAGNAEGIRLKSETQDLSRLLKQVLQSTDGPRTCLNTRAESSRCASSDIGRYNACSASTLVHPNIKACSVVLNKNEVEKYLERHQSIRASSQHEIAQDLDVTNCCVVLEKTAISEWDSQACPLEMKIEIGSNPPSPGSTSFGACSAPSSPGAASLGSSSDNEEHGDISQDGFDKDVSSAQCSMLDTGSGHAKVSVSRENQEDEVPSKKREIGNNDRKDFQKYSKKTMHNRFRSASKCIENSTLSDHNNFSDQKPQMVLADESSNILDSSLASSTDLPQEFEKADRENSLTCTVCKTTFCHAYSLNRHFKSNLHKINVKASRASVNQNISLSNFFCEICNITFNKKSALKLHAKRHLKQNKIILRSCDFCSKQFSSRKSLTEHIFTHLSDGKYFCYSCKYIFNSEVDLNVHVTSLNCKNLYSWQCNYCSKKLNSKQSYSTHVSNKHNVNLIGCIGIGRSLRNARYISSVNFECTICDMVFAHKYNLSRHLLQVHKIKYENLPFNIDETQRLPSREEKEKKRQCRICEKTFSKTFNLHRHMRTVHDDIKSNETGISQNLREPCKEDEMHIKCNVKQREIMLKNCDFCSKKFSTKRRLTNHIFVHLSERKYFCYNCKEIFSNQVELKCHAISVNCKKLDTWQCKFCDKLLASKQSYMTHVTRIHNVNLIGCNATSKSIGKQNDSRKQFKCKICGLRMSRNYNLKLHVLYVHKKEQRLAEKHCQQETLQCEICGKIFTRRYHLFAHISMVHFRRKNKMGNAGKSNIVGLSCREGQVKQNEVILKNCDFCSKQFSTKQRLTNHICIHLSERKYFCYNCKEIFNSAVELKCHATSLSCKKLDTWQCKFCDKILASKKCYRTHIIRIHNINLIPHIVARKSVRKTKKNHCAREQFKCNICSTMFTRNFNLQRHLLAIHNLERENVFCNKSEKQRFINSIHCHGQKKLYNCKICKKNFLKIYNLQRHMSSVHHCRWNKKKSQNLTCNECSLPCRNMYRLRLHMLKVHNVDAPRLNCTKCDSSFLHRRNLEKHLKVSHATGDFMCEICGASFTDFFKLKNHIKHHQSAHFACQVCIESFENQSSLKFHVFWTHVFPTLPHTAWEYWKPDVLLLECDFCDATFTSELQLETHTLKHLSKNSSKKGEDIIENSIDSEMCELLDVNGPLRKFFPCFACNEEFAQFSALRLHITTHHKDAQHMQCKLCDKSYTDKFIYIAHLQRCHTLNSGLELQCPNCPSVLKSQESLERHFGMTLPAGLNLADCCVPSREKKKRDRKKYSCEFCENVYSSAVGKWKHVRDYHPEEWKHKCKFCGKKFLYLCRTLKHERSFHKEKCDCPYCKISFAKQADLKQHVLDVHNGKPAFFCEKCNLEFPTRVGLQFHRSKHASFEFNSHKAQMSNESAETGQTLLDDVNNMPVSSQYKICPSCNLHFPTINQLQIHIYTFHQKINCYSCIECGSVFPKFSGLELHMQNKHTKSVSKVTSKQSKKFGVKPVKASNKIYECEKCGGQYQFLRKYLKHVSACRSEVLCQGCGKSQHYIELRCGVSMAKHETRCKSIFHPYKCDKCPLKFVQKFYLQCHKLKHELCWADRMSCSHCPLSFDSITKVLEHYTKYHMNLLPFPLFCKLCDFNCDNKVELKLHATQHNQQMVHCNQCHRDVSVARFQRCHILTCKSSICSMCSMECGSTANLFLHMQQDHETAGEKHSCLLCLNSFPSESNLQQHVIHNHGQASFKCDICKVNIPYKENLRSHIKLHIHSKTRCRICGREFGFPSSLLQHTLKEHKDAIPPNLLETLCQL